ncbi:uncharacterized protein [Ptychodera flava]|uniref:uncharacterized protein n=1 Tax=Ptychodera flava TaxID=63121 RepID=UPI00396A884C
MVAKKRTETKECLPSPVKSRDNDPYPEQNQNIDVCNVPPRRQLTYSSVTDKFKTEKNWKETKAESLNKKLCLLKDEKLALEHQRSELERPVREASPVGSNTRSTCAICHRRGHRATGNKNSEGCLLGEACKGFVYCGRKDKHTQDHFAQVKKLKEKESKKAKQITQTETELKVLEDFQSKSISAFTTEITPRLMRAFPEKYQARTTKGKVELQHDIGILRVAYDNNISKLPQNDDSHVDRREFSKHLQEVGNSVYSSVKQVPSSSKCSADYLQELLKSSPVRSSGQCTSSPESRKTRGRRCDTEQSEKKRRKNKRERSSSDSSGSEYTNIEAEAYDKYMRRQGVTYSEKRGPTFTVADFPL